MTIYESLKKDHDSVLELFHKIQSSTSLGPSTELHFLFDRLRTELTVHAKAEEEIFYKPLRNLILSGTNKKEEEPWEGEEEHHVLFLLLNELSRIPIDAESWPAKIKVLSDLVESHVSYEEEKIFARAQSVFSKDEATELAQAMDELKQEYRDKVETTLNEDIVIFSYQVQHPPTAISR